VRVIGACNKLGTETVLAVSQADRDSLPARRCLRGRQERHKKDRHFFDEGLRGRRFETHHGHVVCAAIGRQATEYSYFLVRAGLNDRSDIADRLLVLGFPVHAVCSRVDGPRPSVRS